MTFAANLIRPVILFGAATGLAACTPAVSSSEPATRADNDAICSNDALAAFVGQKASVETGSAMLAASGAKTLRWAPPRSAMTMDYRPDRLTVSYDDDMVIIRASCG
ncbi:MAG: I78 family peptidase inhibitor [Sphingobium sp.]|nr:peptidase inhibitor I78 [Sphingobium sp.]MCP5399065.1 peptidase inhibitor I78 [Sphingomonas sp.]